MSTSNVSEETLKLYHNVDRRQVLYCQMAMVNKNFVVGNF